MSNLISEQAAYFLKHQCPIAQALGIESVEFGDKKAKAVMHLDDRQKNHYGMAHGGALFTLADIAAGMLAKYLGYITVTLSANTTFFKPGMTPLIYAESEIISDSGKIACVKVKITDQEAVLLAECDFLLYKKNPEHFKATLDNLGLLPKP
ncbi:MAG: PaaI family thioesterase [Deltaproteobacteria bacterium]|jgi:acyl-CoA thioesterase|nr:PaaI family thioesterase [Deltaproteobacteria bacterium]